MNSGHDTEVATSPHFEADEPISNHPSLTDSPVSSDAESSVGSEYKRYCSAIEIDADIACTHETNEELERKDAVKKFFEDVENMDTLQNSETREKIGSLPSRMFQEPVPLFTDFDTRTDYQLHFSYTTIKALPTWTSSRVTQDESDDFPDYYVHCLSGVTENEQLVLISKPDIAIPLGKLFINKNGRSNWTGYEVFVSSDMAVWMIYVLDEDNLDKWDPVDCSLSRIRAISGSAKEEQAEGSTGFKIARLWNSLRTLRSALFEDAAELIRVSQFNASVRSFRLLEISTSEVPQALSSRNKSVHRILEITGLRVNAESYAGQQLLSLAVLNPKKRILKLKFKNQAQSEFPDHLPLGILVVQHGDWEVYRLCYDHFKAGNLSLFTAPDTVANLPPVPLIPIPQSSKLKTSEIAKDKARHRPNVK